MPGKNSSTFKISLPSDLEIVMEREFDAPRELVFKVWTEPEHVKRWWGCNESKLVVCEADVRPGGQWRYVMQIADGSQFPFKGEYRELSPPERLVHTSIYDIEPYNAEEALVTVVFQDLGGRTKIVETTLHTSKEARDGHVNSGMEYGAAQSLDKLEVLLDGLA